MNEDCRNRAVILLQTYVNMLAEGRAENVPFDPDCQAELADIVDYTILAAIGDARRVPFPQIEGGAMNDHQTVEVHAIIMAHNMTIFAPADFLSAVEAQPWCSKHTAYSTESWYCVVDPRYDLAAALRDLMAKHGIGWATIVIDGEAA